MSGPQRPLSGATYTGHDYDGPLLPYAGTSGHSGGATSEERARRDDGDGTTAGRQQRTLRLLDESHWSTDSQPIGKQHGLTWKELARLAGWHHGQASGVLSVLHKEGRIARLTDRRERSFAYVLPEYVDGRETQEHGRTGRTPKNALTTNELAQVYGAEKALELGSGAVVPGWRVKQLIAIIERISA